MTTKLHVLLPTLAALLTAASPTVGASVIYADDFNVGGNDTAMNTPTSVGGYSWVETGNTSAPGTVGDRLRFYNGGDQTSGAAYVDYDLDGVEQYTVTLSLQLYTLQQNGNFVFSPRNEGTTAAAAANHWAVDTDTNLTTGFGDLYFNGTEIASNILELDNQVYTVSMAVTGNNATLTISDGTGPVVTDTQSLGSVYNNSTPDYALFGYNSTGGSSRGLTAYMDDLSVDLVPEPSTTVSLGLALLGMLSIRRRR